MHMQSTIGDADPYTTIADEITNFSLKGIISFILLLPVFDQH